MKAAYTRYGPPDVIEVDDLEKPVPRDNEVLLKVCAASVNPLDWKTMTGGPYIVRLLLGLRKPKIKQLGVDVAGQVEAVGGQAAKSLLNWPRSEFQAKVSRRRIACTKCIQTESDRPCGSPAC